MSSSTLQGPSLGRSIVINRRKVSQFLPGVRKLLPTQRYSGPAVKACGWKPVIGIDWNSEFDFDSIPNLSDSSRDLLGKYQFLDERERRNLKMKIEVEARASQPLDAGEHLHILYVDEHICVTMKPSGVLSVPGARRKPSLAGLVYDFLRPNVTVDQMIVHRIDMGTSGVIVYALTGAALSQLHDDFRIRRVKKTYEAILAGHLRSSSQVEIDLALERDPFHPPFMRVAQGDGDSGDKQKQQQLPPRKTTDVRDPRIFRFLNQTAKPSFSELYVESYEYLDGIPVTRVSLVPHTGRTHQLRVHCAALGFPIVGDEIYGLDGEGDCGVAAGVLDQLAPDRLAIQKRLAELDLPLCLHARKLCIYHPFSGAPMEFASDPGF